MLERLLAVYGAYCIAKYVLAWLEDRYRAWAHERQCEQARRTEAARVKAFEEMIDRLYGDGAEWLIEDSKPKRPAA